MKNLALVIFSVLNFSSTAVLAETVVKPDPWKSSDYSVLAVGGRFAAYIGLVPVILDAKLREKEPKTYLEAIQRFGPAFTSRVSSTGVWEWHFTDGMFYRVNSNLKGPLESPISLKLEKSALRIIGTKQ